MCSSAVVVVTFVQLVVGRIALIFYNCLLIHDIVIRKKRKDSLEGSLNRELFAAELEFPKILVPRLPQHTSNVNIECAGKSEWSKQLYSLYVRPVDMKKVLGAGGLQIMKYWRPPWLADNENISFQIV